MWGEGGMYGTFLFICGKPKCMTSALRPVPNLPCVASFWLPPNTLHPFMCIDVKFVHKTQHLLTFFLVIFTSLSFHLNSLFFIS